MRPPQFAGEKRGSETVMGIRPNRFNEAPAVRGGKDREPRNKGQHLGSFNEAPAVRGGKGPKARSGWRRPSGFNEAPAVRGGKGRSPIHSTGKFKMLQ